MTLRWETLQSWFEFQTVLNSFVWTWLSKLSNIQSVHLNQYWKNVKLNYTWHQHYSFLWKCLLDSETGREFFLALLFLFLAVFTKCKHVQKHCNEPQYSVMFSKTSKDFCFELGYPDRHTFRRRKDLFTLSDVVWPFSGSQHKLCSVQHMEFTSGLRVKRSYFPYRTSWLSAPQRGKSFRPREENCAASKRHWESHEAHSWGPVSDHVSLGCQVWHYFMVLSLTCLLYWLLCNSAPVKWIHTRSVS